MDSRLDTVSLKQDQWEGSRNLYYGNLCKVCKKDDWNGCLLCFKYRVCAVQYVFVIKNRETSRGQWGRGDLVTNLDQQL